MLWHFCTDEALKSPASARWRQSFIKTSTCRPLSERGSSLKVLIGLFSSVSNTRKRNWRLSSIVSKDTPLSFTA